MPSVLIEVPPHQPPTSLSRLFVCVCGEEFEAADFGLLNRRNLVPVSDERLQPAWRTKIKGYSTFVDPKAQKRSWVYGPITSTEAFRLRFPETTVSTKWKRRPSFLLGECPLPRSNSIVMHRQRFEALFPEELAKLVKRNHYEVLNKKYMPPGPVEDSLEPTPDRSLRGHTPSQAELIQSMASFLTADWETFRLPELFDWWRSQLGTRWWNNDARFSFWGKRLEAPVSYRPTRFEGTSQREREWHSWYDVVGSKREYHPRLILNLKPNLSPSVLEEADQAADNLRAVVHSIYGKEGRKFVYDKEGLSFTVHGKAELDQALDRQDLALKALCPNATSADAAGEVRKDCYRPFVLKWAPSPLIKGDNNVYRWHLVHKQLKHIDRFDDTHRFSNTRFLAHGKFNGATTTGAVAHGDFYRRALDERKILDGELERHRGECGHEGECEPPTQDEIDSNIVAIEAEIQATMESVLAERAAYEYLPRREWVDGPCGFRLISKWIKPGHYETWKPKIYISPLPTWKRPTQATHGAKCHQPNAAFLLYDGYTGNSKLPEWVKGFGKLGKLKKTSSGEYPFIQVNLEHYKATKEIVLEQVDFKRAERPTKEQLQWAKEVTGTPAEPRGEKFIRQKSEDTGDIDEDESYHTGDDEEAAPGYLEGFHVTDDGGTKETDPMDHEQLAAARRWRDAKAAAGEFHNLNDPREFTREQNGITVNTKNEEFQFTAYMMRWLLENPTKDPDKVNVHWLEDTAEALDTSVDALRKRFDRAFKQIKEMEQMKEYEEIPETPLTPKQEADVANGAIFVLVKLNEWHWYKLDITKHGTFDAALEALKADKQMEAMRKRPEDKAVGKDSLGVWKETNGTYDVQFNTDHPEWITAFKEVKDRFDKAFHPARIRVKHPPNPKWKGLIGVE